MTVSVTLTFQNVEAAMHALARLNQPLPLQQGQPAPIEQKAGPMMSAAEVRERAIEAGLAFDPANLLPPMPPVTVKALDAAPVEQTSKRRGRPPKAACVPQGTDQPAATAEPQQPAVEPAKSITKNEALAKFKAVHDSKGLPVCMTVLQRLGAKRFADVSANLYPDLLKLCDRAIAGEDLTAVSE